MLKWTGQITVAVNVSPVQFKSGNFVQTVANALNDSRLPASRLELEVTELVLMQDTNTAHALFHRLKDIGVSIAMDDFGTGYSHSAICAVFHSIRSRSISRLLATSQR